MPRGIQVQTLGIESEAWARTPEGVPADVEPIAKDYRLMNGHAVHGHITREPGAGSIEFAAAPSTTVRDAVAHVRSLHAAAIKYGLNIEYTMQSPFNASDYKEPDVKKSRYGALWSAARQELEALGLPEHEVEERLSRMGYLNTRAATHVHIGFGYDAVGPDHIDHRVLFAVAVLNRVGPRFARLFCRAYGIDNTGHLGITWGWGDPRRFCRWDIWHRDFRDFRKQFESLPRMMRPIGDADPEFGEWEVDLVDRMRWGHPADAKTGYWPHVRPRWDYRTIEVRLLPSWPIESLEDPVASVIAFVQFLLDVAPAVPFSSFDELRASPAWRGICSHRIVGERIPLDYDEAMWTDDVFC